MNWSEERYVKVFTRDTPTWLAWPWQARAIAPLLMRKLENSGRLAVGRLEPARAVALTIHLPIEVVEVGLPAMLEDGTLELRPDGLWWPRFEEAQESRKSDALNSREYRARQRRESSTPTRQTASDGVRERQTPSASSTAQHSTAQHDLAPSSEPNESPKPRRERKPSAAQEFFGWLGATRAGKTPMSDAPIAHVAINKIFGEALTQYGRPACERAYMAFLALPEPSAMTPPWPWQSFVKRLPMLITRPPSPITKTRTLQPGEDPYAEAAS